MTSDDEGLTIKADLIIKGGEVFDPTKQAFSQQDIAIGQGKVLRMAPSLVGPPDACVIHATGKIVTPGLIDAHVHAFPLGHLIGIDVDPLSSRSGVTTFVDAGSTGSLNFLAFRKYVIERVRSNLFALLNVSAIGETVRGIRGMDMYESDDLRFLHLPSAIELIEGNRHIIVGVKVRVYTGLPSLLPLSAARELANEVELPLVVHLCPVAAVLLGGPALSEARRLRYPHIPPRPGGHRRPAGSREERVQRSTGEGRSYGHGHG